MIIKDHHQHFEVASSSTITDINDVLMIAQTFKDYLQLSFTKKT